MYNIKNTKVKICRTIAAKQVKCMLDLQSFVFNELLENVTLVLKCVAVGTYMKFFL
jgi:hypothetical protein